MHKKFKRAIMIFISNNLYIYYYVDALFSGLRGAV